MVGNLISLIRLTSDILTFVVFADILVGYFLDPYHPIRRNLDAIVQPFLAPIRRNIPSVGMFDFSALILLILIQVIASVLIQLLI